MNDMGTTHGSDLDESRERLVSQSISTETPALITEQQGALQHRGGGGAASGEDPPVERRHTHGGVRCRQLARKRGEAAYEAGLPQAARLVGERFDVTRNGSAVVSSPARWD